MECNGLNGGVGGDEVGGYVRTAVLRLGREADAVGNDSSSESKEPRLRIEHSACSGFLLECGGAFFAV